MKIQFIISGWYYDQDSLINGLIKLNKEHEIIDIFYSCHREPPQIIKDNFKWKLFPNLGLPEGAYSQATDYLEIEDDTVCFWMHDDLIIKDWNFINECIYRLNHGFKVIGNCSNYPNLYNPNEIRKDGPISEMDNKPLRDYVKEENRHLFDEEVNVKYIRSSFQCFLFKTLKEVGGWETTMYEPLINEEGNPHFRKEKGIGGLGNLGLVMMSYKFQKIFGTQGMIYLSNSYLDSPWIYECARGKVDPNNPIIDFTPNFKEKTPNEKWAPPEEKPKTWGSNDLEEALKKAKNEQK